MHNALTWFRTSDLVLLRPATSQAATATYNYPNIKATDKKYKMKILLTSTVVSNFEILFCLSAFVEQKCFFRDENLKKLRVEMSILTEITKL